MVNLMMRFLVSLRTAIFLIGFLCLFSIIGTVIPQGLELHEYLIWSPHLGEHILKFGLDQLFRGRVFQGTLLMLTISTVFCIVARLRLTRDRLWKRLERVTVPQVKAFRVGCRIPSGGAPDFGKIRGESRALDDGTEIRLNVSGKPSLVGGILIHMGFLGILAGGLLSYNLAAEMTIHGRKGMAFPIPDVPSILAANEADRIQRVARFVQGRDPKDPQLEHFLARVDRLKDLFDKGLSQPRFRICLDDLWLDNASGPESAMGLVRGRNTRISVFDSDGRKSEAVLRVNEPFRLAPFVLYQAGWAFRYEKVKFGVQGGPRDSGGGPTVPEREIVLQEGVPFQPDWSSQSFVLERFIPNFGIRGGEIFQVSDDLRKPAALIYARDSNNGEVGRTWGFGPENASLSRSVPGLPYTFIIKDSQPEMETVLRITHDPGVPLVWLGCGVLTLGLFLSFYIAYIEVWVVRNPDGSVLIAVWGNRPTTVLARLLEEWKMELGPLMENTSGEVNGGHA